MATVKYQPLISPSQSVEASCSRLIKQWPIMHQWKLIFPMLICLTMLFIIISSKSALITLQEHTHASGTEKPLITPEDPVNTLPGDPTWKHTNITYKHTSQQLPNCILIGARKGGTKALITSLNLHPDIKTAKGEVHYFDREENFSQGLDWYRQQMPHSFPGQITMEKSPAYFHEERVPQRIYNWNSSIKILLIVRDPVVRAISDHCQQYLLNYSASTFEERVLSRDGSIKASGLLNRSMYSYHYKRWVNYFSPRQIHVVDGDAFMTNPLSELKKVETFLGIAHWFTVDKFVFNKTKGFYCFLYEGGKEKCLNQRKGRTHPHVDPFVIKKLQRYYAKYNKIFYRMVDRDFGWDDGSKDNDDED